MAERIHHFGAFRFDADTFSLWQNDRPVTLGQRALAVLAQLLGADGATVSKDDLIRAVWPDAIVEDSNLTVQVASLRRALGQTADGRDWIITIPRLGYRFIDTQAAMLAPLSEPATIPKLTILPFRTIGAPDQDYFAAGLVEDMTTALGRFANFVVTRAANAPKTGYVLTGTLRRAPDRLRLVVQLADATTGAQHWAETFDSALDDIFAVQDAITAKIVPLIDSRIETAEFNRVQAGNMSQYSTYDQYLRARRLTLAETAAANAQAYHLLMDALKSAPDDPYLLTGAAWVLEHRLTMGWPAIARDDRQDCLRLTRRAIAGAKGNATLISQCAINLLLVAHEYDWAMALLQNALSSNPNNIVALIASGVGHVHCGDIDIAARYYSRAIDLVPDHQMSHIAHSGLAHVHMIKGNFERALLDAEKARAQNQNFDPILWILIAAHAHLGNHQQARAYLDALLRGNPDLSATQLRAAQPAKDPSRLASILSGLCLAGLPN